MNKKSETVLDSIKEQTLSKAKERAETTYIGIRLRKKTRENIKKVAREAESNVSTVARGALEAVFDKQTNPQK